jgi:hypothetical protein
MTPETFPEPDDDPAFLNCVDRLIAGLIERHSPDDFYLVRIANWFDHKWLRFSGIGRVPYDRKTSVHTVLDEFSQDQLTFPPFTPSRVITQNYFSRSSEGVFHEQAPQRLVHRTQRGRSSRNLHRRVADFSQTAVFLWFSSNSAANRQGSVMSYASIAGQLNSWYAAFRFDRLWKLGRVHGVSISQAESYLARTPLEQSVPEERT